jgi:hypothetical protein
LRLQKSGQEEFARWDDAGGALRRRVLNEVFGANRASVISRMVARHRVRAPCPGTREIASPHKICRPPDETRRWCEIPGRGRRDDNRPSHNDRNNRPSHNDRNDGPSHNDRNDRPSHNDRNDRPSHNDRNDRPSHDDRNDRPSHDDRSDRPSHDDRGDGPAHEDRCDRHADADADRDLPGGARWSNAQPAEKNRQTGNPQHDAFHTASPTASDECEHDAKSNCAVPGRVVHQETWLTSLLHYPTIARRCRSNRERPGIDRRRSSPLAQSAAAGVAHDLVTDADLAHSNRTCLLSVADLKRASGHDVKVNARVPEPRIEFVGD